MKPFLKSGATILLTTDGTWNWMGWDGVLTVSSYAKPLHLSNDNIITEFDVPLFTLIYPREYTSIAFSDTPGLITPKGLFMADKPTLSDKIKVGNFYPLLLTTTGTFTCFYAMPSMRITPGGPIPDPVPSKSGTWKVVEPKQQVFLRNSPYTGPCADDKVKNMTHMQKMGEAYDRADFKGALLNSLPSKEAFVKTMAGGGLLLGLAFATGIGEIAAGVMLVAGAAFSAFQIYKGAETLVDFYDKTDAASTCESLGDAGKQLADGVVQTGEGVVGAILSVMGAGVLLRGAAAGVEVAEVGVAEGIEGESGALDTWYDNFASNKKVNMDSLPEDESMAKEVMKSQGRNDSKIQEVLESGRNFEEVPLQKGDELYGFGNASKAKDENSAYWITKDEFENLKARHYSDGKWDSYGVKQTLAIPCTNSADTIYTAEVLEPHTAIQSTVNPTSETLYEFTPLSDMVVQSKKSMTGGGLQLTPDPSKIKVK